MCSFINILLSFHYPSFKSNGTATNVYSTVDRCRSTDSRDRGYLNTNPCTWSSQWWTAGRYCQSSYRQANQISWPMCAVVRQSDPDCCDLPHASPRRPPPWRGGGAVDWRGGRITPGHPPPPPPTRAVSAFTPSQAWAVAAPRATICNAELPVVDQRETSRNPAQRFPVGRPPLPRPNNRLLSQNHISLISEHL